MTHALDQAYEALDAPTARVYRDLGAQPLPGTTADSAMAGAVSLLDPTTSTVQAMRPEPAQ
ncbi:hypothetical protein ACFYUY_04520 [Kitasatospora sp. NPDC004745]|uniref:hypothetical protein n=1 Tax=Kitasatospora sp. NPDC004745 TaxID=3364019 RepID=UPI00368565C6